MSDPITLYDKMKQLSISNKGNREMQKAITVIFDWNKEAIKKLQLKIFSPICDSMIKTPHQIEKELNEAIDKIFGEELCSEKEVQESK